MILFRVFTVFLLLLVLPDWYIYKTYITSLPYPKWKLRLYWLPTFVLFVSLMAFIVFHEKWQSGFGYFLIVLLSITVPKALFVLTDLLFKGGRRLLRLPQPGTTIPLAIGLFSFGYILYGSIWGKENFQIKEVTFTSPSLPAAFDGYRILQISDIHIGSWKGNQQAVRRAVELCNAQQADIIVFTGDLVNSRSSELTAFMPILSTLKAKEGVFSVLGNHDYGTYANWASEEEMAANLDTLKSRERQMGWDLLLNEHRILRRVNDSIALVGVENCGRPPFPQKARLDEALKGTDGLFKVLMSHDPTHWRMEVLPKSDVQLMLAGHTHDMQISIFGFTASQFIYPEHNGLYVEGERGLYVNIGLGFVLFPMRLGAWPEITVITLKKQ